MKKINWSAVVIVGLLIAMLLFATGIFGGWGYGNYGYRGWGMMGGPGMMGGWGYSPFGWFGMGLGMLFMWLIPIGVIALIVFGVASLLRNTGNTPQTSAMTPCPNCGKGTRSDWQNCPYCGTALK
ncbi:MAG: zinc ribbon domain-containing protein [Chloroflexi bacterium]|nr:zinc ribbon domain-containing protein [Chloroflexota bacterium]